MINSAQRAIFCALIIVVAAPSLSISSHRLSDDQLIYEFEPFFESLYDRLYIVLSDRWGKTKADEHFNDAKMTAAVYGLALNKIRESATDWNDEYQRLYDVLRRHCEDQIHRDTYAVAESRGWDEWERAGHEALALQKFNNVLNGVYADLNPLERLILVQAPDLLGKYAENRTFSANLSGMYDRGQIRVGQEGSKFCGYKKAFQRAWSKFFELTPDPRNDPNSVLSRYTGRYMITDGGNRWVDCTAAYDRNTGELLIRYIYNRSRTFTRDR